MKKLLFVLALGALSLTSSPIMAQNGADIFVDEFAFITDDGCGPYDVSGTVKLIFTQNGVVVLYDGIATEVATGESVPLHVRVVNHGNQNSFTAPFTLVYASKAVVHSIFHINITPDGLHIVAESSVKCSW